MNNDISRRKWLASASAVLGAGLAASTHAAEPARAPETPFGFCLNTSTIQGQKLPIADKIDIAAKAGFQAIEPWIRELDQHVKDGGSLKDLGKRIRLHGLTVASAIGFSEWIVDDDARRKKGMEETKRAMDLVLQIGGKRLAAPPAGTVDRSMDLSRAAERYRALLELGEKMGVVPQLELWGFSKSLSRLGEVLLVAAETGHPQACLLLDVYHLYKGGSGFQGLHLLGGQAMHVIHMNDYPDKPRADITDADRVYPGDGVAPLKTILRDLRGAGFRGMLSLELFNRTYWMHDALTVARTGIDKMRTAVHGSLE